ncbi:division/cell wall cluster transcriptional repressor MraZ [Sphingomonas nostoxanthinifaciens]|uniref:division/cell wall cluster transcriptional repressor MraZ n=1 Tax=Sphingomonas nostoxanthinifaciens TaxID=2872652 RepID=UPI001CC20431|nr:hypothetical protein [Sphingomonas nostoxanthinifaciens]UAK24935.1 hypothetical protein K8P63_01585 [Sphingomonas nostoxanthinifaciens]
MSIDHPFTGYALNAVDAKGRVSVPAPFRELIATRCLVYAAGDASVKDNVLQIGTNEEMDRLLAYDAIAQRQISHDLRESVSDLPAAERRKMVAELGSGDLGATDRVTFDPAGRMVIPPMLREFAGIGEHALFWGTVDYFEIWDPIAAREAFADNLRKRKIVDYLLRERGIAA